MLSPLLAAAGALAGFLTVALGAFGAHALSEQLTGRAGELWRTAVLYQGLHSLALLYLGSSSQLYGTLALVAGWLLLGGILLFSGSLYLMALGLPKWLGAITPLGGTAWLAGWLLLAWSLIKTN